MKILGQSKGVHSSWLFARDHRIMFDAGEGCSTYLSGRVCSMNHLFITHGHVDHMSGLLGLLAFRQRARSEKALAQGEGLQPLTVHYPKGTQAIQDFRDFLSHRRPYSVDWHEMVEGEAVTINGKLKVDAFRTDHYHPACSYASLGFSLHEHRTKMNPKYAGMTGPEIGRLKREKRLPADFEEHFRKNLLVYTGDTRALNPDYVRPYMDRADTIIHDATFLDPADLGSARHSTAVDALAVLAQFKPRLLLGCHVSPRSGYVGTAWKKNEAYFAAKGLQLLHPEHVLEADTETGRIVFMDSPDRSEPAIAEPEKETEPAPVEPEIGLTI